MAHGRLRRRSSSVNGDALAQRVRSLAAVTQPLREERGEAPEKAGRGPGTELARVSNEQFGGFAMGNVAIQTDAGGQAPVPARQLAREWDPFRVMRELLRWDPFGEAPTFRALESAAFAPDFEVKETKEGFEFRADVPGVKEGDLDIRLTQNRLAISGKRESEKTEKGDTFYTTERSYGSFTRSFTLPEGIQSDKIHAELKEGVLTLLVPKKPEAQPKKIDVKSK
jgi:HSP20 family protein